MSEKKEPLSDRRKFILTMARSVGLAALGGLVWSAHVDAVTHSKLVLRPPGALDEEDFLKTCIKCGLCVEACPYDTLFLASPGQDIPLGTPYFEPRKMPCYMCTDIPCVPVCPTDALSVESVSKDGKLDIKSIDMGVAVLDHNACIAYWGIQCDACYRACPILDEAIKIEYRKNERTGKHALRIPVVQNDVCTGCGMCEKACITEKASIFVLPREIAEGKAGSHYIKGWDKADEQRLKGAETQINKTKINKKSAIDALNDGEDLY